MKKRLLSGVKPTGSQIHIGNYFGAVRHFVNLQDEYDMYAFIANLHAITTVKEGEKLREQTLELIIEYLACGLDPTKATIFLQSDVPEHTELAWIFNCLTPMGLLNRAHAYKDAVAKNKEINVGVFDYPVLMAADILIYKPAAVPVGKDQKQHVEIARDIAEVFNTTYSETFPLPDPIIDETTQTIVGLDGQKMSKSYNNTIMLFEDEKSILKKVKSIVTDSKGVDEPKDPETCSVFQLYKLFATPEEKTEMEQKYRAGGLGYGQAKEALFEVMMRELKPLRDRYAELSKNKDYVLDIVRKGGQKAREMAVETMKDVRKKVGIL